MSWSIIRELKWTKDHDWRRVQSYLAETYTPKKIDEIKKFVQIKIEELRTKFGSDSIFGLDIVYDDSGWDLCAEVVGRGNKFYENITAEELKKMKRAMDYVENFEYSFSEVEADA